jgi:hypothetical protein
MSNAQERKQALIEHRVITDVLPGDLNLSYDLTVTWPNTKLDKPGQELGREDTQPEPELRISPAVCLAMELYAKCTDILILLYFSPPKHCKTSCYL